MDDESMWAADRVVTSTLGFTITIPETTNEFAIKGYHLTLIKGNQFDRRTKNDLHKHIHKFLRIYDMFKNRDTKNEVVRVMMYPLSLTREAKTWLDELNEETIKMWDELQTAFISNIIKIFYHGLNKITQEVLNVTAIGIFLYKTPNQAYQLLEDKVLLKIDWAKNQKTKSPLKKTITFVAEGSSNFNTNKIIALIDSMTIKIDAQYKELQSRVKQPTPDLDEDDMPMSREEEAKFIQTVRKTYFYNDYHDRDSNHDNWRSTDLGASINLMPYSLYAKLSLETLKPTKMSVSLADRSFQYPVGIAKNMIAEVGKFTFHADFVILKMEEDSKVPLILG
uniref:Reverse transcriptase domain-containing protein n=1 Tax=Tanacetum cinerariifolium TaxID=118510 RepID=A0A6L2NGK7_TANCI|nr:reverse transcriptase domain-containing protein [Tanacetum cinerariifolium]